MTDEQLTAPRFQVPDDVQASQARREAAREAAKRRPCAGDGGRCRRQAIHAASSSRGGAYCPPCWKQIAQPTTTAACGCTESSGRRITDPVLHATWHAQLVADGLPPGPLDATTLRLARGASHNPARTVFDVKAEAKGQRASGALREASR